MDHEGKESPPRVLSESQRVERRTPLPKKMRSFPKEWKLRVRFPPRPCKKATYYTPTISSKALLSYFLCRLQTQGFEGALKSSSEKDSNGGKERCYLIFLIILLNEDSKMDIGMFEICLGTVIGYSILGWLVFTGIKINYGRLSNSLTSIYFSPRIGWFIF
jgi:hypothetical protein